jgi:hypothetical protein
MSTKIVFYIVKGFGRIKRGMRVKRKCKQDFASKPVAMKRKKLTFHQGSQLILGQNISSLSLKNKWSPHHVLTLHAMRNSKKSKW